MAMNNFFYESAYLINSNLANFGIDAIQKARQLKRAEVNRAIAGEDPVGGNGRPTKRQKRGRLAFRDAVRNAESGTTATAQFTFTLGDHQSTPAPAPQTSAPAPPADQTLMLVDEPVAPAPTTTATPSAPPATPTPLAGPSTPFPAQTPTTETGFAGLSINTAAANAVRATRNTQAPNGTGLGKRTREPSGTSRPASTRPDAVSSFPEKTVGWHSAADVIPYTSANQPSDCASRAPLTERLIETREWVISEIFVRLLSLTKCIWYALDACAMLTYTTLTYARYKYSRASHTRSRQPRPGIGLLLLLLIPFIPTCQATPQLPTRGTVTPFLTTLALNCNKASTRKPGQLLAIMETILSIAPSIFILTEFAVLDGAPATFIDKLGKRFKFYCTPSNPDPRHPGIVMGVDTSIPSTASPFQADHPQSRRILPVTVRLPSTASALLAETLIMGIYSPQASNSAEVKAHWEAIAERIGDNPNWIISGDFNMALDMREISPGHALKGWIRNTPTEQATPGHTGEPARPEDQEEDGDRATAEEDSRSRFDANHYRDFLNKKNGADLWQLREEVDLLDDFTRKGNTRNGIALSVIDRTAIGPAVPGGSVTTIDIAIDTFDHRPILSQFAIPRNRTSTWVNTPRRRRLIFPKERRTGDGDADKEDPFEDFEKHLTELTQTDPSLTAEVKTNKEWDNLYDKVTKHFRDACDRYFSRPSTHNPGEARIRPCDEGRLIHDIHTLNMARKNVGTPTWPKFLADLHRRDRKLVMAQPNEHPQQQRQRLLDLKHTKETELKRKTGARLREETIAEHNRKTDIAIASGSAKRLLPNQQIHIPPFVSRGDGTLATDKTEVLRIWRSDFKATYYRQRPSTQPKPWMDCKPAKYIRVRTKEEPFVWPQRIDSTELHNLLRSGNPSPAPGPDDWEKWALRRAGDAWHVVIANLLNYMITQNYFPPSVKDNLLVPIYKRGDFTRTTNYRGIVLANTLQGLAASWLRNRLQAYASKMGLIPSTQSAGRLRSRQNDHAHLLHALDGHLRLMNRWCYGLKRDQKKGFDYLHANAFDDAVKFFGLPRSIVEMERARAHDVKLSLRIRDEVLEPIVTDGLTKQGDPMSPLKYALSLAMAQWWIADKRKDVGCLLRVKKRQNRGKGGTGLRGDKYYPHTTIDGLETRVTLLAAMDDTVVFAENEAGLIGLILDLEYFQASYNMETEWDKKNKTTLMCFGRPSAETRLKTVEVRLTPEKTVRLTPIPDAERRFLNTPINSPEEQYRELHAIINNFVFPLPGRTLPVTAIRRITEVSLMSKIRPKLELHPVTAKQATRLNTELAKKLAAYFLFAYPIARRVLFAPIAVGGLGFPDIEKTNAVAALSSIHHILNPEDGTHVTAKGRPKPRPMDIIHTEHQCEPRGHRCWHPIATEQPVAERDPRYFRRNKENDFVLEIARNACITMGAAIIPVGRSIDEDHAAVGRSLTLDVSAQFSDSPNREQLWRDDAILDSADVSELMWATDGSEVPTERGQEHDVGIAIVGPIAFSARLLDRHSIITDAEPIALGLAIWLDQALRAKGGLANRTSVFLCDNLNSVQFANKVIADGDTPIKSDAPSRAAYRFLRHAVQHHSPRMEIRHVRSHTDDKSKEATLNEKADKAAKAARNSQNVFGIQTKFMDTFSLRSEREGFTHAGLKKTLQWLWDETPKPIIFRAPGDNTNPDPNRKDLVDEYWFTRSRNGWPAEVQLLIRGHQLDTPARSLERPIRDQIVSPDRFFTCAFCDHPIQRVDERHIFVDCPGGTQLKEDRMRGFDPFSSCDELDDTQKEQHRALLRGILTDNELWGNDKTMFWQGLLPANFDYHPALTRSYKKLNGQCLKLTGSLWWNYKKKQLAIHKAGGQRRPY